MKIELQQLLAIVQGFAEGRGYPASKITAESLLLHEGILDSFSLVELLMIIEQQFRADLSSAPLTPDDFQSVRALCAKLENIPA